MLKTITKVKQMRLDELIKHIFDNDIRDKSFTSNISCAPYFDYRNKVYVHLDGTISLGLDKVNDITCKDLYTVEVEEEITKDTEFESLVEIYCDPDGMYHTVNHYHETINYVEDNDTVFIYALINNKLELILDCQE